MMTPAARVGLYLGTHPDDANALGKGFKDGFVSTINPVNWVKGLWNTIWHPIKTGKNIVNAFEHSYNILANGTSQEQFELLGNFIGCEAACIFIGETGYAIKNYVPDLKNGNTVYRIYGGQSKIDGACWTTKNPKTIKNYRNKAGLPNVNTGEKMVTGVVTDASKVKLKRRALALDGNKGGLPEYVIPNPYDSGGIQIITIEDLIPNL